MTLSWISFGEYQAAALKTAIYPNRGNNWIYPALGLVSEAGEVADKFKKIIRDKDGVISEEDKLALSKELGDVMWYVAVLAEELGLQLDDVAISNLAKLASRKIRDKLSGSGDDR